MDSKRYWSALNRVTSKHVAFVLLRPEDLTVIGVIELDDRSHERRDRAARDPFVDEALRQGGIPICHIKTAASTICPLPATQHRLRPAGREDALDLIILRKILPNP